MGAPPYRESMPVETIIAIVIGVALGPLVFFGGLWALSEFADRIRVKNPAPPREEDEDEIDHRFY